MLPCFMEVTLISIGASRFLKVWRPKKQASKETNRRERDNGRAEKRGQQQHDFACAKTKEQTIKLANSIDIWPPHTETKPKLRTVVSQAIAAILAASAARATLMACCSRSRSVLPLPFFSLGSYMHRQHPTTNSICLTNPHSVPLLLSSCSGRFDGLLLSLPFTLFL